MLFPLRDVNPVTRRPEMTWALIAVTTGVFAFQALAHTDHAREMAYLFGIVPARFSHPEWAKRIGLPVDSYWPFVTSIFLHAGVLHLVSNMWILWIFGDNVEDRGARDGSWRST